MAARAAGDAPGARRALDRAMAELERTVGAPVAVDVPNGFADVSRVEWSPNGRRMIALDGEAGDDGHAAFVDTRTWRVRFTVPGLAVAFTPDAKRVLSTDGLSVRAYDVASGARATSSAVAPVC